VVADVVPDLLVGAQGDEGDYRIDERLAPLHGQPGGDARHVRLGHADIEETIRGKEVKKIIGVRSEVYVFKSSIWKPFGTAPVSIIFDYGIDDIRENLQFIKDFSKYNIYTLGGEALDKSMLESIKIIEQDNLENELKEEVINLWEEIEKKFKSDRKPKR
jgi:hypothetical protein